MAIKAILFDMDGVLVDSEKYIRRASIMMFKEKGFQVQDEDFFPFTGTGEDRFLGEVAKKYGIPFELEKDKARTYAIYEEITDGKLIPLPGVDHALDLCRTLDLKRAVCTSADEIKMLINLKQIGVPLQSFNATVFADMVEHKKPAPDIFLAGADLLGVQTEECLVIEDAPSGLRAAKEAGMRSIGLMTSFDEAALKLADLVLPDLSFLNREHLNT